jgi:hypothetical protein
MRITTDETSVEPRPTTPGIVVQYLPDINECRITNLAIASNNSTLQTRTGRRGPDQRNTRSSRGNREPSRSVKLPGDAALNLRDVGGEVDVPQKLHRDILAERELHRRETTSRNKNNPAKALRQERSHLLYSTPWVNRMVALLVQSAIAVLMLGESSAPGV